MNVFNQAIEQEQLTQLFGMFSGGHDSLTATALVAKHPSFAGVVHLNTGIGIEQTREFVRDTCAARGWPLHEIRASAGRYEELVLTRGGFPWGTASHNTMLFYLKQQPLLRWYRKLPGRIGLVTGIRREESTRRMGAGISVPIRRDSKNTRITWVSPILDWSKTDCNQFIEGEGLRRNLVVDLLHRSGECLCGALARPGEIHEIARWFPETAQRINALETECERRGIVASIWASGQARRLNPGQTSMFSKAELAPLCTSCEAL